MPIGYAGRGKIPKENSLGRCCIPERPKAYEKYLVPDQPAKFSATTSQFTTFQNASM